MEQMKTIYILPWTFLYVVLWRVHPDECSSDESTGRDYQIPNFSLDSIWYFDAHFGQLEKVPFTELEVRGESLYEDRTRQKDLERS